MSLPLSGHVSRTRLPLAVLIVSCMLGCAAKPSPAAERLDPTFVRRVNSWCATTSKQFHAAEGTFPVSGFDPRHPSASSLPAVGRYLDRGSAVRDSLSRQLDAVGLPGRGAATWSQMRSQMDASVATAHDQVRFALAAQPASFTETVVRAHRQFAEFQQTARRAGLGANSPCLDLF
jgi:hypothetical protein